MCTQPKYDAAWDSEKGWVATRTLSSGELIHVPPECENLLYHTFMKIPREPSFKLEIKSVAVEVGEVLVILSFTVVDEADAPK
jgi:hypothetical protein